MNEIQVPAISSAMRLCWCRCWWVRFSAGAAAFLVYYLLMRPAPAPVPASLEA